MEHDKRTLTDARIKALEKAQAAKRNLRLSPTARQQEKFFIALKWVHAWGWSTSEILCQVVGSRHPSFLTRMCELKLLKRERLLNQTLYLATPDGVKGLRSRLPESSPLRTAPLTRTAAVFAFEHHHGVQLLMHHLLKGFDGARKTWASEKQLRIRLAGSEKIPDAAIYLEDGRKIYIEYETEKKYNRELDQMIGNLIKLACRENVTCEIYTRDSMMPHYRNKLLEIRESNQIRFWDKGADGKWHDCGLEDLIDEERSALTRIHVCTTTDIL